MPNNQKKPKTVTTSKNVKSTINKKESESKKTQISPKKRTSNPTGKKKSTNLPKPEKKEQLVKANNTKSTKVQTPKKNTKSAMKAEKENSIQHQDEKTFSKKQQPKLKENPNAAKEKEKKKIESKEKSVSKKKENESKKGKTTKNKFSLKKFFPLQKKVSSKDKKTSPKKKKDFFLFTIKEKIKNISFHFGGRKEKKKVESKEKSVSKKKENKSKKGKTIKNKFSLKRLFPFQKKDSFKDKKTSTKKKRISSNSKSQKNETKKRSILFSRKWVFLVGILCVLILCIEIVWFIFYKMDIEHKTIYYDSLNSLSIDNMNVVLVGSSNFKYSKNYSYTNGLEKAKFMKYDLNGKLLFEKMYDKGINTTFSSIISVDDGYVIVGSGEFSEEEHTNGAREAMIIKYDKDGNLIWEKYYQVLTNTRFNKVIEVDDGYVAVGQSIYANLEMGNHTTGGGIIVKYDKNGNEIWHNNHGGTKSGNFYDIIEVDRDLYLVGKDGSDSGNLVKYDRNGKYQWHKNYSYTDGIGFTGIAYSNQFLYVVGSKKILSEMTDNEGNHDTKNTDALLVKYDKSGNIIFEKNFGGSSYERYNSILAYRDNLFVVGYTSSTDAGLKINTDGNLLTGILVRYDSEGNILKKESLGGSNNDNLTDIASDGVSLYITAYSNSKDGNITTSRNNGKDYFGKMIKMNFKFKTLLIR